MKMCRTTPITFSSLPTMDRVSLSVAARLRRSTNILVTAAQHSWGQAGRGEAAGGQERLVCVNDSSWARKTHGMEVLSVQARYSGGRLCPPTHLHGDLAVPVLVQHVLQPDRRSVCAFFSRQTRLKQHKTNRSPAPTRQSSRHRAAAPPRPSPPWRSWHPSRCPKTLPGPRGPRGPCPGAGGRRGQAQGWCPPAQAARLNTQLSGWRGCSRRESASHEAQMNPLPACLSKSALTL